MGIFDWLFGKKKKVVKTKKVQKEVKDLQNVPKPNFYPSFWEDVKLYSFELVLFYQL